MTTKLNDLESLACRIHLLCCTPEIAASHHLGALYQLKEPDSVRTHAMRLQTTAWQLSLRGHWVKVNQAFQDADIPVVLLKGLRWSDALFPSPWMRPTGDLDILIRSADIGSASNLLEKIGAKPDSSSMSAERALENYYHLHFRFGDVRPSVLVELHWQITAPRDIQLPDQVLWANIEKVQGEYVLNQELDLLLVCIHAFKHAYNPYRTLVDVERMIALRGKQIRWDCFWDLAEQAGATRAVVFVLFLSSRHLAYDLPPEAKPLSSLQNRWFSVAVNLLSPEMLLEHSRYSSLYKFYVALVTGTWPTLRGLMRIIFAPHPEALAKVYGVDAADRRQVRRAYLLRPFRLMWKFISPVQGKSR